jgi:hypothetical protein
VYGVRTAKLSESLEIISPLFIGFMVFSRDHDAIIEWLRQWHFDFWLARAVNKPSARQRLVDR